MTAKYIIDHAAYSFVQKDDYRIFSEMTQSFRRIQTFDWATLKIVFPITNALKNHPTDTALHREKQVFR